MRKKKKRGHGEGRGSSEGHKMGCYTSCAGHELETEPAELGTEDGEAAGAGRAGSVAAEAVGGGGDETMEVHWD